jgi:hypothetical protein
VGEVLGEVLGPLEGLGTGVATAGVGIGGNVICGSSVSSTIATSLGDGDEAGTAPTGDVNDRTPAARKVTPSAVTMAGMIRVRMRFAGEDMGPAW